MRRAVAWLVGGVVFLHAGAARSAGWEPVRTLAGLPGVESAAVQVVHEGHDSIELIYRAPKARLVALNSWVSGRREERIVMGNLPWSGGEGLPRLPVIPARLLLPADTAVDHVEVIPGPKTTLPGSHTLEHAQRPFPLMPGVRPTYTPPDPTVYARASAYPDQPFQVVGAQGRRGAQVLLVNLFPVEYVPQSGLVSSYETLTVQVYLTPRTRNANAIRYRPSVERPLAEYVDNPGSESTYLAAGRALGSPQPTGLCNPSTNYQYVVVTSEEIKNAQGQYSMTNFVAHKRAKGLTATIMTVENIYTNYSGVDNAEKLRNFIIDAYNTWGTDYVLLGGDINIVPMRKLWCTAGGEEDNIPSDLYYQCLDGTYNGNGNDKWGEPTDGPGGGDVDLVAEIYVGRASAENTNEMANFVYKTMAYEDDSDTAPYLRTALMCGEYLGFGGISDYAWPSMEEIRNGATTNGYTTAGFAACDLFTVDTLYDTEANTWTAGDLLQKINSGTYSIINHLGHANYDYVMKFYNADADALTNNTFLFAYSQGCIPGNFEADCIGEHLTTSTRHGMYAVVFNSRYGWGAGNSTDGPSQRFDRQFWDGYFGKKLLSLGALNANSHEANLWDLNGDCIRWCYYESNLLGDPQTPMRGQFISDAILVIPVGSYSASGGVGGPFLPASRNYTLIGTATNGSLNWSASHTQAWVSLSATNGSLGSGEQTALTVSINTNANAFPEGDYFDTIVFTNTTNGRGSTNWLVHLVVNNPPVVTNSSVQAGDRLPAGDLVLTIQFSEPMKTNMLNASAFSLIGEIYGSRTPTNWGLAADGSTLSLQYGVMPEDRYTLTLLSGAGRFEDRDGFALDGETLLWPIPPNRSGNRIAGGDFSVTFELDAATTGYPVPLQPVMPLGSLVYDRSVSAFIAPVGDTDRFTLAVNTGQTITVVVRPDTNLQPAIALFNPSGSLLAQNTAGSAGAAALIQTAALPATGTYAIVVSGVGVSTGRYDVQTILNAAREEEEVSAVSNDTPATAQNIDAGFIPLVCGARRAAVVGAAAPGPLTALYDQDFESGLGGFVISNDFALGGGLWHVSSGRGADSGHSHASSVYYGHNEGPSGGGDYDTGAANAGAFYSPVISLPFSGDINLTFNYFLQTEGSRSWDIAEVAVDDGDGFQTLLSSTNGTLPVDTGGQWTNAVVSLSRFAGCGVVFRFSFNTIDAALNHFEGWYVDDIHIETQTMGIPDCYSFNLSASDTVTLVATALAGQGLALELLSGNGTVVAEGQTSSDGISEWIQNCAVPTGGVFNARVSGRGVQYSLVVVRNADFAVKPDNHIAAARCIDAQPLVLGGITGPPAPITAETEPNDDGVPGCSADDLALANDWRASFTNIGVNTYQASLTGTISSGNDGDWDFFRISASPGDSILITLDGLTLSDPYLRLYDRNGTLLTYNDDNGSNLNSRITFSAFAYPGDYYVVADSYGSSAGSYRLAAVLTTTNAFTWADMDYLSFSAVAGNTLTVQTWTPGGRTNQFANNFEPAVDLLKMDGTLLASNDHGAPDGRNALLSNLVLRTTSYVVRVRAAAGSGEYLVGVSRQGGPPVVSFSTPVVVVYENQGTVLLPVVLSAPTSDTVTVDYAVTGGTATGGGVDYTLTPGTLTFGPGQVSTNVVIGLVNDTLSEGTETIHLRLSNPVHANLGEFPTQTVIIVDDELPLRVQFSSPTYAVGEEQTNAVITVTRTGGVDGAVTVNYATANGSATAGVDYQSASGTLVLADGVASNSFLVPLEFDMIEEPDKTVNLALSNPTGGAVLGNPASAVLTVLDYKFSRTNRLLNSGFENPANTNDFSGADWLSIGLAYREPWAAHSGAMGGTFQGWVSGQYGIVEQWIDVGRGTYTFSLWARQEPGFMPYFTWLELYWYGSDWTELQPATVADFTALPGDSEWHHLHVTGTCTNSSLAYVYAVVESYWGTPVGSPSAFMFDDATLCAGSYTGVPSLANCSFEEGLTDEANSWRGSQWYAVPEFCANARCNWGGRTNVWGGTLYGWDGTSNCYTTCIGQNLTPGTGTFTLALWILREPNFLLTNAELRFEWYDSTFTNKVQADSVSRLDVPADNAWHEYFLIGSCSNKNLFEVRAQLYSMYLYNPTNVSWRGMKMDDARFARGQLDMDGDGIPDYWETAICGNDTGLLANGDADGDGFNNLAEYVADTCPTDSSSFLRSCAMSNGLSRWIVFPCSTQRLYNVWCSTNLVLGSWQMLGSNYSSTTNILSIEDTNNMPFRFYRIEVCPP